MKYTLKRIWKSYPVMTILLIAVNVILFVLMDFNSNPDTAYEWYMWGGSYWPSIVEDGEYYRLLTSIFLHSGISHLMSNMLVLGVLGSPTEKYLGHIKYLAVYLGTGIGANVISKFTWHMLEQDHIGVGASGAIFGIFGVLLAIVIKYKGTIQKVGLPQMLFALVWLIYGGYNSENVDQLAHLGGLLIGIILGWVLYRIPLAKEGERGYDRDGYW